MKVRSSTVDTKVELGTWVEIFAHHSDTFQDFQRPGN